MPNKIFYETNVKNRRKTEENIQGSSTKSLGLCQLLEGEKEFASVQCFLHPQLCGEVILAQRAQQLAVYRIDLERLLVLAQA